MNRTALLITVVSTVLSTQALAGRPLLGESVDLTKGTHTILRAFRDHEDCHKWYYIPAQLMAKTNVIHDLDFVKFKANNQSHRAFISSIRTTAHPMFTDSDLVDLKKVIYNSAKGIPDCTSKIGNESNIDIALISPLVTLRPIVDTPKKKDQEPDSEVINNFWSQTSPSVPVSQRSNINPNNLLPISYSQDATAFKAKESIEKLFKLSSTQDVSLGFIGYEIGGLLAKVNCKLTFSGQLSADFNSAVEKTRCTVSSSNKDLSYLAGAAGLVGAGMGVGGVGYSENSTTCEYNLMTTLKSAEYKAQFHMDHSGSQFEIDGQPIMHTTCNEKEECRTIPLESFVEAQLYTQFVLAQFDVRIKNISEKTYEVTLGKRGQGNTVFQVDSAYLRNLYGKTSVQVQVIARNLNPYDLDFSLLQESPFNCITSRASYYKQTNAYTDYISVYPMPVNQECAP